MRHLYPSLSLKQSGYVYEACPDPTGWVEDSVEPVAWSSDEILTTEWRPDDEDLITYGSNPPLDGSVRYGGNYVLPTQWENCGGPEEDI